MLLQSNLFQQGFASLLLLNCLLQRIATVRILKCKELLKETEHRWIKFLKPSLFPNVPPTIRFSEKNECPVHLPLSIRNELNWGKTLRFNDRKNTDSVIRRTGLNLVKRSQLNLTLPIFSSYDYSISSNFKSDKRNPTFTKQYQKINQLPNILEYDDKIMLTRNQQNFIKEYGRQKFPWFIPTYIIPEQSEEFRTACNSMKNKIWVEKPNNLSNSIGIKFFNGCSKKLRNNTIIQKYIHNPLTLHGKKLEFRKYVVLTGIDPFKIYVVKDELIKLPIKNFTLNTKSLKNGCIHVPGILRCKNINKTQHFGYLGLLTSSVHKELRKSGINISKFRSEIEEAIIKTLFSAQAKILEGYYKSVKNRYNAYNLVAFDFFIDQNLHVWLNEVSRRPGHGLHTGKSIQNVIANSLTLAGYNLPPGMNKENKELILENLKNAQLLDDPTFDERLYKISYTFKDMDKQHRIEKMIDDGEDQTKIDEELLKELTSDEVRQLIIAEDELNRIPRGIKRIFPSSNMKQYFKYIQKNPYNYWLFNAYGNKYGTNQNRQNGIEILRILAKENYHLK